MVAAGLRLGHPCAQVLGACKVPSKVFQPLQLPFSRLRHSSGQKATIPQQVGPVVEDVEQGANTASVRLRPHPVELLALLWLLSQGWRTGWLAIQHVERCEDVLDMLLVGTDESAIGLFQPCPLEVLVLRSSHQEAGKPRPPSAP